MKASGTFAAFLVFDPRHLPSTEDDLSTYGTEKLQILTKFFGCEQKVTFEGETGIAVPDIDREETETEWKIYKRVLHNQFGNRSDPSNDFDSTRCY